MKTTVSAAEAAALIPDNAVVSISSSSGLGCPDAILAAIGARFQSEGAPRGLTTLHPIAAGDSYGIDGIDHLAQQGLLARTLCGSYPSAPSSAAPPRIWQLIGDNKVAAYNIPSGILFDMHREAAAKRPGVLTKIGMHTFVDPAQQGCAMNASAAARSIVRRVEFDGDEWLYFPAIAPQVAIIRATTADARGNLSYEHEGAYLGALQQAMAARNNGGMVIAQVKRQVRSGSLPAKQVHVPGVLVDCIVLAPEQMQTTRTQYDAAVSGEIKRDDDAFSLMDFGVQKVIARRAAMELQSGWAVNLGFGVAANVPRVLLEEGLHGEVTWVIEQGAVGGVPLLDFKFGCAANAEAFLPSPEMFCYFQGGGFDASLLSFLQIGRDGSVNVSKLSARPHVTAGAGGFVDITARARKIIFCGMFNAAAKMQIADGKLQIEREGKVAKLVQQVEQVSFNGARAAAAGQEVLFVTERCVMKLGAEGLVITEVAPGVDVGRDILSQAEFAPAVADEVKMMPAELFAPAAFGLRLKGDGK